MVSAGKKYTKVRSEATALSELVDEIDQLEKQIDRGKKEIEREKRQLRPNNHCKPHSLFHNPSTLPMRPPEGS
jgi:hypothetical protein